MLIQDYGQEKYSLQINKVMEKQEILCFGPTRVVDKEIEFLIQGTLINEDDSTIQIALRLENETLSLIEQINEYVTIDREAMCNAGDNILIFDVFYPNIHFEAIQINKNYVKVKTSWYHHSYGARIVDASSSRFNSTGSRKR